MHKKHPSFFLSKSFPYTSFPFSKILSLCLILSLLLTSFIFLPACNNEGDDPPEVNTYPLPVGGQPSTPDDPDAPPKKRVAITFDDGPHIIYTKQIVNELDRYGFTATFFIVGNRADGTAYKRNNVLSYIAQKGHEIAIHGYTHDVYYDTCYNETFLYEMNQTVNVIKAQVPDASIKLMRPVGGRITTERASACNYAIIMWSVDSEDWRYKYKSGDTEEQQKEKVDTIVSNVMNSVRDGSIILLHDIYESTYDAACIILARLYEEGYEVVSVSELLGTPQPGVTYRQK